MVRRANRGSNKNQKPSSYESRKLKAWMMAEFGDGDTVPCHGTCGRMLVYEEVTKDRYPVPGRKGGRYVKGNVRPMCMSCNASEGARQGNIERAEARRKKDARNARRRELYAERKRNGLQQAARGHEQAAALDGPGGGLGEGRRADEAVAAGARAA